MDAIAQFNSFSNIPIFQGVSSNTITELESVSTVSIYKKKHTITVQGEFAKNLLIVKKGMVNLFFTDNDYEEIFYTSLSRFDQFGIYELFFSQTYNFSAIALTDCEIYEIPSQKFLQIVSNCHQLQLNINYEFAELLKRSYDIIRANNSKIEKKILNTIILLAEEIGYVKSNSVEIKSAPNQSEIALMAGTTRETISRTLSVLQKRKSIMMKRSSIVIPDYESFKKLLTNFN